MRSTRYTAVGIVRLEILFALALLTLLFQLFPSLWNGALIAADPRNWSRGTWLALNIVVVFALIALRFGRELYAEFRRARPRKPSAANQTLDPKKLSAQEERELYQRMHEARKKQIV